MLRSQKLGNDSSLNRVTVALTLFLMALILAPLASAKTAVDFDPGLDFSKFKTFAYIGGTNMVQFRQLNPKSCSDRVHSGVAQALTERGLKEVQPDQQPTSWCGTGPIVNPASSRRPPEAGINTGDCSPVTGPTPTT